MTKDDVPPLAPEPALEVETLPEIMPEAFAPGMFVPHSDGPVRAGGGGGLESC